MRASGYDRNADDWYVEPAWLVDALLDVEDFSGLSWDPAAGGGNIPARMKGRDLDCVGTDIVARGDWTLGLVDFMQGDPVYSDVSNVISNPPYGILQAWIDRSLGVAGNKVAILARLAFLEGQKRKPWFEKTRLARVWVSARRASMPPGGSDVKASGGAIAYAWFVWDHSHKGPPTLGWLK